MNKDGNFHHHDMGDPCLAKVVLGEEMIKIMLSILIVGYGASLEILVIINSVYILTNDGEGEKLMGQA